MARVARRGAAVGTRPARVHAAREIARGPCFFSGTALPRTLALRPLGLAQRRGFAVGRGRKVGELRGQRVHGSRGLGEPGCFEPACDEPERVSLAAQDAYRARDFGRTSRARVQSHDR
jgi:hypothetical protein